MNLLETIPASKAKTHFSELLKRTREHHESFAITRRGKIEGVLISIEEYESLIETLEILSDSFRGSPPLSDTVYIVPFSWNAASWPSGERSSKEWSTSVPTLTPTDSSPVSRLRLMIPPLPMYTRVFPSGLSLGAQRPSANFVISLVSVSIRKSAFSFTVIPHARTVRLSGAQQISQTLRSRVDRKRSSPVAVDRIVRLLLPGPG